MTESTPLSGGPDAILDAGGNEIGSGIDHPPVRASVEAGVGIGADLHVTVASIAVSQRNDCSSDEHFRNGPGLTLHLPTALFAVMRPVARG